jgi:MFS family permease
MDETAADAGIRVFGYRWVVLAAFMFANAMGPLLWMSYAPIIAQTAEYYQVSHQQVSLLAMIFMIVFIPLALPAAWAIRAFGIRSAVGFGVGMMGVFAVLRGFAGDDYALVLLCSIGIAVGQPFLLDAWTKVPADWFPLRERATAVGLTTLANMLGTAVGMALSPLLAARMSIASMQLIYGMVAAASAIAFLLLVRDRPSSSPSPVGADEPDLMMLDGLRHALRVKSFLVLLAVAFVVMGVVNGVITWVGDIILPRGFDATAAGLFGALMTVSGVVGAVVLSALSDRRGRRVRYLVLALSLTIPSLIGVAFASQAWLLYLSAAALGFFVVAALPIGMQYAAEVTAPAPESASNGLVQLVGQCAVVFIFIMGLLRTSSGSFWVSLMLMAGLLGVGALAMSRLPEPTCLRRVGSNGGLAPDFRQEVRKLSG